jgi:hypothetical protein
MISFATHKTASGWKALNVLRIILVIVSPGHSDHTSLKKAGRFFKADRRSFKLTPGFGELWMFADWVCLDMKYWGKKIYLLFILKINSGKNTNYLLLLY